MYSCDGRAEFSASLLQSSMPIYCSWNISY